MNTDLLRKHIKNYLAKLTASPKKFDEDIKERQERAAYYKSWTTDKLRKMTKDDLAEYLSKLWAMRIWGNKQYVVDQIVDDNGLPALLGNIADLVWSNQSIENRWDSFRKNVKGIGPAMMSEILCHAHPEEYMLWNRRAYVALNYLGVPDLPRYNYQFTGKKYAQLCATAEEIAQEMRALGSKDTNLLIVDYFIWDELQVADTLEGIFKPQPAPPPVEKVDDKTSTFIHDEVRDAIVAIGNMLNLQAEKEKKVSTGAVVDAVWEATIGNMGRVIYVFEVQTKGSIDSLMMNFIRAVTNPAVQRLVAVSDPPQLAKIQAEAAAVPQLKDKLTYWNYAEVLAVHTALESVTDAINSLGLVPQGF
ncbi:MAG: hypothetical protein ABSD29_02960 [Verrucomicrobiota bacterium]|jgi:hypothetical protein